MLCAMHDLANEVIYFRLDVDRSLEMINDRSIGHNLLRDLCRYLWLLYSVVGSIFFGGIHNISHSKIVFSSMFYCSKFGHLKTISSDDRNNPYCMLYEHRAMCSR